MQKKSPQGKFFAPAGSLADPYSVFGSFTALSGHLSYYPVFCTKVNRLSEYILCMAWSAGPRAHMDTLRTWQITFWSKGRYSSGMEDVPRSNSSSIRL